jgi:hypothetical protein
VCRIWYHCIDRTTTHSLTEFVAKLYTWNESPSCSFYITVNFYGFKHCSFVAACTDDFDIPLSGTAVLRLFVDMLLDDSVMYLLKFVYQSRYC